jgi:predicted extracellular nuclease
MNNTHRLLVYCSALALLILGFQRTSRTSLSAENLSICEIQGEALNSPYAGDLVTTTGIVSADFDGQYTGGFFVQAPSCDQNDRSSDALYVYQGGLEDPVERGDQVEITGVVQEYLGLTEVRVEPGGVRVLSKGHELSDVAELDPPFDPVESEIYLESLEGMQVYSPQTVVVGPTGSDQLTWVVRADLDIERVFEDDPRGTGELLAIGDGGYYALTSGAAVGDRIGAVYGVLDEELGVYIIQLLSSPELASGAIPPSEADPDEGGAFTIATFNLSNLFDTLDDPETEDEQYSSAEYQRRLNKLALAIHISLGEPDLLAVQEVENYQILRDLALRPEIERDYEIVWSDTPDPRGQDTALLYAPERFALLDFQLSQTCTSLVDGLGPDGNQDALHPENELTCDLDSDGEPDGNRLFSRPVLVVHLLERGGAYDRAPLELIVLVNHWKSKTEDSKEVAYTLPRRIAQAEFVAGLTTDLSRQHPGALLIVAGDLNDYPLSEPLTRLRSAGLRSLGEYADKPQRYSYIYRGVSQVLDYLLMKPANDTKASRTDYVHINSDYPFVLSGAAGTEYRSSDHDPLLARFVRFSRFVYLPLVRLGD